MIDAHAYLLKCTHFKYKTEISLELRKRIRNNYISYSLHDILDQMVTSLISKTKDIPKETFQIESCHVPPQIHAQFVIFQCISKAFQKLTTEIRRLMKFTLQDCSIACWLEVMS